METEETVANPAYEGIETLPNPGQSDETAGQEASSPAEGDEGSIDDLAREALGETTANPDDEIEVEYEGEKRKLPPKWRDALLRHQDYTHKTMSLAEERKVLETERESFQALASQIDTDFTSVVQLASLQQQIEQLSSTSIRGWTEEQKQVGIARLAHLQNQARELQGALHQRASQRTQAEQAQLEKARELGFREAAARIPNFTEQRWQELRTQAIEHGVPNEAIDVISEPWEYETLHYADIGRKFVERQRKAASMKSANAGTPSANVGGLSGGGKSPEAMSVEEYMAWRAAGNG